MNTLLIVGALFLSSMTADAAILMNESGVTKVSSKSIAADGLSLREKRKVAVGIGVAGIHGLLGANLELNFSSDLSFGLGFGFARGFQEFHLQIKKVLAGRNFLPYISGGYTRWFSSSKQKFKSSSPQFFAKRFLNSQEKSLGNFSENLLFSTLGIQYLILKGDWAGTALYAEANLMIDVDDLLAEPTGGAGMLFYF